MPPAIHYDVICVGAGPAGSTLAYRLAKVGFTVALVERGSLPRDKVCGGGLTPRALRHLPIDIGTVTESEIERATVRCGAGREIGLAVTGGCTVERTTFDAYLAMQAVEAGASLFQRTTVCSVAFSHREVCVETTSGPLRARLLVGADGAHSRIRQQLFPDFRPSWAFGLETRFRPAAGDPAPSRWDPRVVFDFAPDQSGYGWIFPKRDHFNVGVYRLHKRDTASLHQWLGNFAANAPELAGLQPAPPVGHPVPLSTGKQPLGRDRAVLVGDAAGLTEAFFGEGIAFALQSAELAAEWAERWLASGATDVQPTYDGIASPVTRSQLVNRRRSRTVSGTRSVEGSRTGSG